jgi:acetoin utilization deacetylase AcuC-like enzyme
MPHHEPIVEVHYRPEVAAPDAARNVSRSPTKPRRFVEWLLRSPLATGVLLREDFAPALRDDLLIAHDADYVDGFFAGRAPHATSNGLHWSPAFAESVRYTNGSLVAALRAACDRPSRLALSPTSGFHHARPSGGSAFCTFSGQVIASVTLHRERGLSGAWIDLDGHFGNSIEDSRDFVPDLDGAIRFNLNPRGAHRAYLTDLEQGLAAIGEAVLDRRVHYVAFAHGADSHEEDDLGGQCTTEEWLEASRLVYAAIRRWSEELGAPVPVALALFGGYRESEPEAVLRLHGADLAIALRTLGGWR